MFMEVTNSDRNAKYSIQVRHIIAFAPHELGTEIRIEGRGTLYVSETYEDVKAAVIEALCQSSS